MTSQGFQLYSVHAVDDPLPTVIERVGETAFDGVEFAGLGDQSVEAVASALENAGLDVAGAHVGLDELEDGPGEAVEPYVELGCDDVAVPWLDADHFESVDAVEAAAERLSAVADDLDDHGVSLQYHNHNQEFVDLDGEPALTHLIEATENVGFELDLGWVGAAGYDPLSYLDEHADRVRLVHLKDYDAETGEPVEVGDGDLDLSVTVELVEDHGFDWLIYEAEERPDSYGTLDHADEIVSGFA
ncbi:sugar phosphate isomerase/epimerase family protein [Haloprofundus halobius]|uniref:sugar phosphate isomerase/epimerase family protein n=1 Tax=Haloprofundus halobius TaxID=2876194 RepID=UPI001CCF067E|nr:sugar phosphate isomerase/epimerase [Haloprofundus halobius]